MDKDTLLKSITSSLKTLSTVQQIIVFGSQATNKARPLSDVDIALNGPLSRQDWRMAREIIDSLRTLRSIDLIWYEQADTALQASIDREGLVLYERTAV